MPMRQFARLLLLPIAVMPTVGCSGTDQESATSTPPAAIAIQADDASPTNDTTHEDHSVSGYTNAENDWYRAAQSQLQANQLAFGAIKPERGAAKNVILFVGDGMGVATVTAARILDGQSRGASGEEGWLSFERMPFTGLAKTYNVDAQTPDSAGTMTAIITGVKTDAGLIGVAEATERGNCESSKGQELGTALELAELAGMATGIVTTTRITHATPAATYAKAADRGWESDARLPRAARQAGCKDIAQQLVEFEPATEARYGADIDGIEVVMGGGLHAFLPRAAQIPGEPAGDRLDGRNLLEEWKQQYPNGVLVTNNDELAAARDAQRLFGLFAPSHMRYEADRVANKSAEPSLVDMTGHALDILQRSPDGFFLVVEGGRIDHAHHVNNAYNALNDTMELANAVQVALDRTSSEDTLIIVTADHSHVMTMAGYPRRGNPILGKVVGPGSSTPALAADAQPFTTLSYANGLGFRDLEDITDADAGYAQPPRGGRALTADVDTTAPGYHQEALVPLGSETHGGEDVGIYASGPGGHLVSGVLEQNVIFHVMEHAADLTGKIRAAAAKTQPERADK